MRYKKTEIRSLIEKHSASALFRFICGAFFFFYLIQIKLWTANPDVYVYSCRSTVNSPIVKYAFLDGRSLLQYNPLPNYHLGHTVILWLVYQIAPSNLADTILPAGFVSTISGALIVGLTFLIWLRLGLQKFQAFMIAIFVGLIPSIWYHSLIGEVYALQLLMILLFVYFFLKNNLVIATLAFLFANLVSPFSALSITLVFLDSQNRIRIRKAVAVSTVSFMLYLCIYYLIDSNIFTIFQPDHTVKPDRSIFYCGLMLCGFVLLNINFFSYYLYKGWIILWREYRHFFKGLVIAIAPQFLLIFLGSAIFVELGSFHLLTFWALGMPVGLALSKIKIFRFYTSYPFIGILLVTLFVWIIPKQKAAMDRNDAGYWLRIHHQNDLKIIGDWRAGIGVILTSHGWDFEKLSNNFIEKPYPDIEDLAVTNQDSLIIVQSKKSAIRTIFSKLPLHWFQITEYNPIKNIQEGSVEQLFENKAVAVYKWKRF